MKLVVINGMPATGKSTLARELVKQTGFTLIAKDDIKEFLFDYLKAHNRQISMGLGGLVSDLIYELARVMLENGRNVIIESAFFVEFARPAIEKVVKATGAELIEVYLEASKDVRRKRFVERIHSDRHPGHIDTNNTWDPATPEPTDKYAPLNVGKLMRINTDDFSKTDIKQIVTMLKAQE